MHESTLPLMKGLRGTSTLLPAIHLELSSQIQSQNYTTNSSTPITNTGYHSQVLIILITIHIDTSPFNVHLTSYPPPTPQSDSISNLLKWINWKSISIWAIRISVWNHLYPTFHRQMCSFRNVYSTILSSESIVGHQNRGRCSTRLSPEMNIFRVLLLWTNSAFVPVPTPVEGSAIPCGDRFCRRLWWLNIFCSVRCGNSLQQQQQQSSMCTVVFCGSRNVGIVGTVLRGPLNKDHHRRRIQTDNWINIHIRYKICIVIISWICKWTIPLIGTINQSQIKTNVVNVRIRMRYYSRVNIATKCVIPYKSFSNEQNIPGPLYWYNIMLWMVI